MFEKLTYRFVNIEDSADILTKGVLTYDNGLFKGSYNLEGKDWTYYLYLDGDICYRLEFKLKALGDITQFYLQESNLRHKHCESYYKSDKILSNTSNHKFTADDNSEGTSIDFIVHRQKQRVLSPTITKTFTIGDNKYNLTDRNYYYIEGLVYNLTDYNNLVSTDYLKRTENDVNMRSFNSLLFNEHLNRVNKIVNKQALTEFLKYNFSDIKERGLLYEKFLVHLNFITFNLKDIKNRVNLKDIKNKVKSSIKPVITQNRGALIDWIVLFDWLSWPAILVYFLVFWIILVILFFIARRKMYTSQRHKKGLTRIQEIERQMQIKHERNRKRREMQEHMKQKKRELQEDKERENRERLEKIKRQESIEYKLQQEILAKVKEVDIELQRNEVIKSLRM